MDDMNYKKEMNDKIDFELGNIQKTLLLPLWGRAFESTKTNPILLDTKACEIIKSINYDFESLSCKMKRLSQLAWIARCVNIDRTLNDFIGIHHDATIVNIGCGLDTTFDRIDNGNIFWYDLDLPDVIALRSKFICETGRRKFISSSFLDYGWFDYLKDARNIFFISAGVFYYFEENDIKDFFINIAGKFPGSEMIFDASSKLGVKVSNKKVIEDSGLDERSYLKWSIEKSKEIKKWDKRIKILEEYNMFGGIRKYLSFEEKIGTLISDFLNIMYMVHLRFK
jgi:O-methyltransferase involved in polyketide biosynthesis